ncbi:hypothetical protein QQ045_002617 [Rhodiola kirilowii]
MQHAKEEVEKINKKMAADLPLIDVEAAKKTTAQYGKAPSSARAACLCSPTTHAGSFRCRLHRTNHPQS